MLRKIKKSGVHKLISSLVKAAPLSILSGILLSLPFWNGRLWLFAWCGFLPLFFAFERASKLQRFLLAYLCGAVFWWATIFWLAHVTFIGAAVLISYLALYFGIFGLAIHSLAPRPSPLAFLFLPSVWVLLEYVRSHLFTGFPWALLGYSQCQNLPIIQIADVTGAWGVSFLLMMSNAAVYSVCVPRNAYRVTRIKQITPFFLLLIVSLVYGFHALSNLNYAIRDTRYALRDSLKVSVIQGNIPQDYKWTPEYSDFIIEQYVALTKKAAEEKPDLIVWPEAALPVVLEEESAYHDVVARNAQDNGVNLLFGAVTLRNSLFYNSAILIFPQGKMRARYDKIHLVPFGEYIPLRDALPFLQTIVPIGDITAGKEYTIFQILNPKSQTPNKSQAPNPKADIKFSVLICFEDLFPELSRQFVKNGADFLVNITNDAWYKKTPASMQHLQASVFRAVENRVPLVRAANTGISGFIAPTGEATSLICRNGRTIFIEGHDTQAVSFARRAQTVYNRHGDACIVLCMLIIGVVRIALYRRKVRKGI